jgi:predicted negative regulator of RcsB-dependent stress response
MFTLEAITLFLKTNIKWLAIIAGLIFISVVGYKSYSIIQENATQKVRIEELDKSNRELNVKLKLAEDNYKLINDQVNKRDQEVSDLSQKLEGTTSNLGTDENEKAPKSVMEYLKRVQGVYGK